MKTTKSLEILALVASILCLPAHVSADTFGGLLEIEFVTIGSPGNRPDDTGYGAVGYEYRISKYEMSRLNIQLYNALSEGPELTLQDQSSTNSNGPNRPATGVSWNEAARFVNWLNTSTGNPPAYKFTGIGANENIELWNSDESGYDPNNRFRNSDAQYFLPSEDEWYKAAYYDPARRRYWDYATGSDARPVSVMGGTSPGTAVYDLEPNVGLGPANVHNAGGLSPYGTMAQTGNILEFCETAFDEINDDPGDGRVLLGGHFHDSWENTLSSHRWMNLPPDLEPHATNRIGFRVASKALTPQQPLKFSIEGLVGNNLRLVVENVPSGQTVHLRKSSDGQTFVPLSPAVNITASTSQPIDIPANLAADSTMLLQVYEGASP